MSTIVYINTMANIKKIGERQRAAEMMAFDPDITVEAIARKLDVNVRTVVGWRADPNFVDMVYQMYMVEFGAEIPSVLSSMIREAKAGNVQAGRLVLEHSGKLVKNINVTIDSPFEKYLQAEKAEVEYMDAEVQDIVEDVPDMPDIVLPERKIEDQKARAKSEFQTIKKAAQSSKRRMSRNRMHKWKNRARAVGVPVLPKGRPTKAQKKEWMELVRAKEKEMRNK